MSKNHVDFSNTGDLPIYKDEPSTSPAPTDIETKLREAADEMRAEDQKGWPVVCDEAADTIAALRKQVSEHKRLKNQLVLKAYPSMDAIEEIAYGFKSAVHFVRNNAMDMERDYPEICQAEKVFDRALATLTGGKADA